MFNKFPPKEYPLHLHITFGLIETELKADIKECLKKLPKETIKYRSRDYYGTSFNCYFKDADSMRPLINQVLKETEMFIVRVSAKEERVFPNDLLKMGNDVLQAKSLAK